MAPNVDIARVALLFSTIVTGATVFLIFGFIFHTAAPVLLHEGLGFLTGTTWSYSKHEYGILMLIAGTIILTAVTLAIACPLGIFTSIYLAEWAPRQLDKILSSLIELLVGIPSVVFGIFGLFVLEDIFQHYIDPFIHMTLGFIPFFQDRDPSSGIGILLSATVLAIMVLPTMVALSREAIKGVPKGYREASLALGATKCETINKIVLPAALPGILTAIILALMRAMGETMAVVMLMGNSMKVPTSILDSGYAMTSKILNDIGYYVAYDEPRSALFAIGAVLFIMEIVFVALIRIVSVRLTATGGKYV